MPKESRCEAASQQSRPLVSLWPDATLVKGARAGDRESFDELIRRHDPFLRRFLARLVPVDAAGDLRQEVWVGAWVSIERFDSRSRFRTWVAQIAMNKSRDWFRSNSRDRRFTEHSEAEPAPHDPFPASDVRLAVQEAVSKLSDERRSIIDLYYAAGLNLPEIARLLGRNLSAVKYQFYEAHVQLEAELGPGWKEARR